MKRQIKVLWGSVLPLAVMTAACASSSLEVPTNHPGHPDARSGEMPTTTALDRAPAPPEPAAVEPSPHPGHDQHDQHDQQATYVCPMHPEIVSKEPGKCPICGMKLEPRKASQ